MQRTPLPASPYHIIDDIEHTELLFGRHLGCGLIRSTM